MRFTVCMVEANGSYAEISTPADRSEADEIARSLSSGCEMAVLEDDGGGTAREVARFAYGEQLVPDDGHERVKVPFRVPPLA